MILYETDESRGTEGTTEKGLKGKRSQRKSNNVMCMYPRVTRLISGSMQEEEEKAKGE